MNKQQFTDFIQKSSDGLLTQSQAKAVANDVSEELASRGKVSPEEFKTIFQRRLNVELASLKSVTQSAELAKKIEKVVTLERTPHWAEEAMLTETEKDERNRNEIIISEKRALNRLYGVFEQIISPVPTLSEHEKKAEQIPMYKLEEVVKSLTGELMLCSQLDELKIKMRKTCQENLLVSRGKARTSFDTLSTEVQTQIEAEVNEYVASFDKDFEVLEKAIPFLRDILNVYEGELNKRKVLLEQQKHDVEKIVKECAELVKSVKKIIEQLTPLGVKLRFKPRKKVAEKIQKLLEDFDSFKTEYEQRYNKFKEVIEDLKLQVEDFPDIPAGTYDKSTLKVALTGHWG